MRVSRDSLQAEARGLHRPLVQDTSVPRVSGPAPWDGEQLRPQTQTLGSQGSTHCGPGRPRHTECLL